MNHILLDTSALLALRDDEPGADRVAALLRDDSVRCHACFMSRMEVLYRVWKDEDELAGRLALQQCLALPIEWVEATDELLLHAAELKARFPVSVVVAWVASVAVRLNAVLVHKDPEFDTLPIEQEPLPLKPPR
ncbi:MAG: PIN domain-containing protein [Wenzhouxiangella sp.]